MRQNLMDWYNHLDWYYIKSLWAHFPGLMVRHFLQLAPYVLLGSMLGEYLKFTSWTSFLYREITKRNKTAIIAATVLGIISPLCTYGTVPVLMALYAGGTPVAPLISFLAASSMLNPQLFIMTAGGIGIKIALIQLAAVFVFGILIGSVANLIQEKFIVKEKLLKSEKIDVNKKKDFNLKLYFWNVGKNLFYVGRMLILGILIASLFEMLPIAVWIGKLNANSVFGVIAASILGIPLYACGGGVIPMIQNLLAEGLSSGNAIAFLISGPATRITSLSAILVILKKRFVVLYVFVLIIFSVLVGILFI